MFDVRPMKIVEDADFYFFIKIYYLVYYTVLLLCTYICRCTYTSMILQLKLCRSQIVLINNYEYTRMIVLLVLIVIYSMCIVCQSGVVSSTDSNMCCVHVYQDNKGIASYTRVSVRVVVVKPTTAICSSYVRPCVCVWSAWVILNNTPPSLHLNVFTLTLSTTTTIVQLCFKTQNHKSIFV